MSRALVFILPALFASAFDFLLEPTSQDGGRLQRPLQGGDIDTTGGFPRMKLNDGRAIPVVCFLSNSPTEKVNGTDMTLGRLRSGHSQRKERWQGL